MNPPSQNLVSIDLSHSLGTVSLLKRTAEGLHVIEELESHRPYGHSEELFEILNNLLQKHSLKSTDIQEWWTNEGPGSFTGLRIALSALKGICTATGAKLILVNGAEARARSYALQAGLKAQEILVATKTSSKLSVLHGFNEDFSLNQEMYVESLPADCQTHALLTEEKWPVRSAYLPLCKQVTVFSHERLALASPKYYGTSVYKKSEAQP